MEPEPRSLKIPDRIALATRAIASARYLSADLASVCGIAYSHVLLKARLKDCHGSQTTTSHGDIWKLIGRPVSSDSEQVRTGRINTTKDEMSTNVALVSGCQLGSRGAGS